MSMNLSARNKNGEVQLWQTPSQISYTILPSKYGKVRGRKAREALERYLEWVEHSTDGSWTNQDDYNDHKGIIQYHTKYVKDAMKVRGLTVCVM